MPQITHLKVLMAGSGDGLGLDVDTAVVLHEVASHFKVHTCGIRIIRARCEGWFVLEMTPPHQLGRARSARQSCGPQSRHHSGLRHIGSPKQSNALGKYDQNEIKRSDGKIPIHIGETTLVNKSSQCKVLYPSDGRCRCSCKGYPWPCRGTRTRQLRRSQRRTCQQGRWIWGGQFADQSGLNVSASHIPSFASLGVRGAGDNMLLSNVNVDLNSQFQLGKRGY